MTSDQNLYVPLPSGVLPHALQRHALFKHLLNIPTQENFKIEFGKHYDTPEEEEFRFGIFKKKFQELNEYNKKWEGVTIFGTNKVFHFSPSLPFFRYFPNNFISFFFILRFFSFSSPSFICFF